MTDVEATLRDGLDQYLSQVEPGTADGVVGVCLIGSLAAGYVDSHSDLDLTLVLETGARTTPLAVDDDLVPETATVWRESPKVYCIEWNDTQFDVGAVTVDDLSAANWDLETRWEYDNAEILVDPSGTIERRLAREVPFERSEWVEVTNRIVEEFLSTVQDEVHKACLRGTFDSAHRATDLARDQLLELLYLREEAFVPREKWILAELDALELVDDEARTQVWEASRVLDRTRGDVHRRVQTLQMLWEEVDSHLRGDCLDESLSWDLPPTHICGVE